MEIDIKEDRHCGHQLFTKLKGGCWNYLNIGQSIEEVELVVNELTLYLEQIKQPTAAELDVSFPEKVDCR